jgi:putative transposase
MTKGYHHASHSKYLLHYHFVFCCKYRKKLLKYALEAEIKQLFLDIADKSKFSIDMMEADIDHIHVLVDAPPTLSPFDIVNRLKSQSTFHIWKKFTKLLTKHFWE